MSTVTAVYNAALSLSSPVSDKDRVTWTKTGKNCHCHEPEENGKWWINCDESTLIISDARLITVEFIGANEDDDEEEEEVESKIRPSLKEESEVRHRRARVQNEC